MALNLNPPSDQGIKNNMVETKEESCSQLAECQRELKGLKKRLLRAEANAYLLAKHLQEHRCEGYKDLIESLLREKPPFLAEDLMSAENRNKCCVPIQDLPQSQEWRTLCLLIHQNLQDILSQQDFCNNHGPDLSLRLAELLELTDYLVGKFSPASPSDSMDGDNALDASKDMSSCESPCLEGLEVCPETTGEARASYPMTCQVATEPQESLDCSGDPTQEDHLAQAISLGAHLLTSDDENTPNVSEHSKFSPEQPRMEQIDVPNGSAVESTYLYSVTTHVVTSYSQTYSNGGCHVEEQHLFMSVSFSAAQTSIAPDGPDSPQPGSWLYECEATLGPSGSYWACTTATNVAATYHHASTEGYVIGQHEHHCMASSLTSLCGPQTLRLTGSGKISTTNNLAI